MDRLPNSESMLLPILHRAAAGDVILEELIPLVAGRLAISQYDLRAKSDSGGLIIKKRVVNAVNSLIKAGLLYRDERHAIKITDRGREVLAANPDSLTRKTLQELRRARQAPDRHLGSRKKRKPSGQ